MQGASITANHRQLTALMSAALDGDTNKVRTLLESGADIDAHDAAGRTALMFAVINRHVSTATALLNAGADMSMRADDERTALACRLKWRWRDDESLDGPSSGGGRGILTAKRDDDEACGKERLYGHR